MPEKFTGTIEILENGKLMIRDSAGKEAVLLENDGTARFGGVSAGNVQILPLQGVFLIHGAAGPALAFGTKPVAFMPSGTAPAARLSVGGSGLPGQLIVNDPTGRPRIELGGSNKSLIVRSEDGKEVFALDSKFAVIDLGGSGGDGDFRVRDSSGKVRVHLDGASGDIKLTGGDCAEEFEVACAEEAAPGTVVVIGPDGRLRPCEAEYDKRVAGIVAGAGGARPGLILGRSGGISDPALLTLTGRAWCQVDAYREPVEAGDLLTTSTLSGHAMRASDHARLPGAVIGKALLGLPSGTGLIPVLATLQ